MQRVIVGADEHGQPLPAELDDCLRGTLQTIQLPPLREGDKLTVKYVFSDEVEN